MKKIGREKLFCEKEMSNGKRDYFWVIVGEKERNAVVSMYKGMGYRVSER